MDVRPQQRKGKGVGGWLGGWGGGFCEEGCGGLRVSCTGLRPLTLPAPRAWLGGGHKAAWAEGAAMGSSTDGGSSGC